MAGRRLSSEERRSQIVRIAAELFSKKGFKGTTTKAIAKKVGIIVDFTIKTFNEIRT